MLASEVVHRLHNRMFMQEYGSRIPEGVTQEQLFPRHRYSDIDLILSGFRRLPEEQVDLLERLGYTVTPCLIMKAIMQYRNRYTPIPIQVQGIGSF